MFVHVYYYRFALCLSEGIIDVVKDVHAIGVNDAKENEKTAELYTSTVVNQEAMLSMVCA